MFLTIGINEAALSQTLQVFKKYPAADCSGTNCINFNFDGALRIETDPDNSDKYIIKHDVIEAVNQISFDDDDHRSLKFVTSNGYSTYITYVHTQRLLY